MSDALSLRKVDRRQFAWLPDVPVAHAWAGRLDGFAIAVLLARQAGQRKLVYIVEGATLGVPPMSLSPEPPTTLGPEVARLCAERPDLAIEVGDATLFASGEPGTPEDEPRIFRHLLDLAAALQQTVRQPTE